MPIKINVNIKMKAILVFFLFVNFQTICLGLYTKVINPSEQWTIASTELIKHHDEGFFFNRGFCSLNEDSLNECSLMVRCDQSKKVRIGRLLKNQLLVYKPQQLNSLKNNNPDYRKEVVTYNFLPVLSPKHTWSAAQSSGWSPGAYYQRIKLDSTLIIINNQSFQQLLTSSDSTGNNWQGTKKYAREGEGKLWVIDSTTTAEEVCIMDMNLKKGDEFSYADGVFGNTRELLVSDVDSIMDMSGQIRKVIHLSCDFDLAVRYRWIEGVGPDVGVFSSTFNHCVIDGNESSLTCFYKDETQHWQNEVFNHCWKPSPPVVEAMIPILNSNIVRYVLINSLFYPHYKMERWKFNFLATVKENAKAYYELLVSEKENGNDFIGSGRFFREEDNRFYQYISPSEGERLLYDMNLKAGDSIMMDYADGPVTLVVTKEDSIQLDDEMYLKRLTLQCVINGELGFGNAAEWIEGIGRLYEPLVDFSHCSVASIPSPEVYCIYDQNQRIYKNIEAPSDCWVDDFYTTDMDTTATWYSSSYVDDFSSGDCRLKIDITKVVRDTSIQYRKCRIIGVFTDGKYLPESEIITFQNADKLYFYEDNNWKLLYDFAARVGDTVTYFVSKKYPYYVKYNVPGPFEDRIVEDNPYQIVIQEIDTILDFSGKPLKRFKTDQISNFQGHFMGEIIENVGSKEKLFGNNVIITPPECNPSEEFPRLRCYSDDDIFIKFTEGECDMLTQTSEISDFTVKLYPNPGNDWLNINLGSGVVFPISYQMTDIAGRIIGTDIQNIENFSVNFRDLTSGLYIISIRDKVGKVWHGKWVKE
jgi:hypothetical protein